MLEYLLPLSLALGLFGAIFSTRRTNASEVKTESVAGALLLLTAVLFDDPMLNLVGILMAGLINGLPLFRTDLWTWHRASDFAILAGVLLANPWLLIFGIVIRCTILLTLSSVNRIVTEQNSFDVTVFFFCYFWGTVVIADRYRQILDHGLALQLLSIVLGLNLVLAIFRGGWPLISAIPSVNIGIFVFGNQLAAEVLLALSFILFPVALRWTQKSIDDQTGWQMSVGVLINTWASRLSQLLANIGRILISSILLGGLLLKLPLLVVGTLRFFFRLLYNGNTQRGLFLILLGALVFSLFVGKSV